MNPAVSKFKLHLLQDSNLCSNPQDGDDPSPLDERDKNLFRVVGIEPTKDSALSIEPPPGKTKMVAKTGFEPVIFDL